MDLETAFAKLCPSRAAGWQLMQGLDVAVLAVCELLQKECQLCNAASLEVDFVQLPFTPLALLQAKVLEEPIGRNC